MFIQAFSNPFVILELACGGLYLQAQTIWRNSLILFHSWAQLSAEEEGKPCSLSPHKKDPCGLHRIHNNMHSLLCWAHWGMGEALGPNIIKFPQIMIMSPGDRLFLFIVHLK